MNMNMNENIKHRQHEIKDAKRSLLIDLVVLKRTDC